MFCEKEFEKRNNGKGSGRKKIFCSDQCRYDFYKTEKDYKFTDIQKECLTCKKKYSAANSNQKYCSSECRVVAFNPIGFNVFERDNFRCAYCGKTSYEDNVKLIVEHIFPRSKGGTNESHNIITACSDCNNRKKGKIMDWNVILTLWQIVDKRNNEKNIDWESLKDVFDKSYPTNQN